MPETSGHVLELLWEDEELVLFRTPGDGGALSLLASAPASAQPSPESLAQLRHAYALREKLDPAWAARPLRLELRGGRLALLSEDAGGELFIDNPTELPDASRIDHIDEPMLSATIITPTEYTGTVMELCQNKRGDMTRMEYLSPERVELVYTLPLAEVVIDFFDQLKSRTKGYASLDYEPGDYATGNLVRVQSVWRVGVSSAFTHAEAGNRLMNGLYAGVRTGPITWLSEVDLVRQAGYPNGTRTMIPALAEADWLICKGNNLKLTYEYSDPERSVANNAQTRWSAVYELTPIPFLQARAGFRRYQGIPQNNLQNQTFGFVEVHIFL